MTNNRLDYLLGYGYFRMQQEMFTCRYLVHNDVLHPVHWLRVDVSRVRYTHKQNRLFRINAGFSVTVGPMALNHEIETLYTAYRQSLDFDTYPSVEACLLGNEAGRNPFDTQLITIRDAGRLVAVGVFDTGQQAIAGILNFYHPDYQRQSLGKYLMLLKIEHARQQQMRYYYPGYIVTNYPKFDYKLFAAETATEVFDAERGFWLPFSWDTVTQLAGQL